MPRWLLWFFCPLLLSGQTAVSFQDSDFLPSDWELVQLLSETNAGSTTASQQLAGGNLGSFRRVDITVNGTNGDHFVNVWGFHGKKNATIDPRSSTITAIDYSEQELFLGTGSGDGQATGPALRQGGKVYVAGNLVTKLPVNWTTLSLTGLLGSQFVEVVNLGGAGFINQNSHPDFSPNGAVIELGFFRANSARFLYKSSFGIDNWAMTVHIVTPSRTIAHIANGASFRTTNILVNSGSAAANFTINYWDDNGLALVLPFTGQDGTAAVLTGSIPAGGTRFIQTVGAGADLQKGWAELIAPASVDGNSIFGSQAPGRGDSEAAVPLSPAGGMDLYLPFDNSNGYVTGVAFADPGIQPATVTASILDDAGQSVYESLAIPGGVSSHGHYSDVVSNPYPLTVQKRGVAHFTADTNIFGLGIRANGKAFTSIEALSGVTPSTKTIPHIANGGGWKTTFLLVSTAPQAAQFTLKFWGDAGAALPLPLGADGLVASVSGTIKPGELRIVQTTGAGDSLVTGWAELSGLTGAIGGTAIFALQTPGEFDSEAAVPFSTSASKQLFMPYDYSPGYSTGIALTNTSATQAVITAGFKDENGTFLGSGQVIVPAHGHASAVLVDVSGIVTGKRGSVSLSSNVPIFGLGIRANGVAFTSLKVIAE